MRARLAMIAIFALALAGCGSTQEHRARQYSNAFGQLPKEQQARVLEGGISLGDSREAVYIALGPPQAQQRVENVEVWEYNARPIPAKTPFTDGSTKHYLTPTSDAWQPRWDGKSGYLALEFEDGVLDAWDYQDDGYPLQIQPGQRLILPEAE